MTEPVKPISDNSTLSTKRAQTKTNSRKVKIGGVTFNKDQIEADKTKKYTLNGKKMNTVFVKPGIQIDYPDQTKKHAEIESTGLSSKWYNPDSSNIHINNLDNATIYGIPNKRDSIYLDGTSSNNKIIVDQKESWYIDNSQRKDYVELGPDTKNNKVQMDETDKTRIFYNQPAVYINGEEAQSDLGNIDVKGKGTISQEPQLKDALGKGGYFQHHWSQVYHDKQKK